MNALEAQHLEFMVERRPVVDRLNDGLAGTAMAGLGGLMEQYGWRYGINPFFVAGVAETEASLGAAGCGGNPRNVWGLGNCGSAWSPPYFASWADAFAYYYQYLHDRWGFARTPWDFSGYAACAGCWAAHVERVSLKRFGVMPVFRYGHVRPQPLVAAIASDL